MLSILINLITPMSRDINVKQITCNVSVEDKACKIITMNNE